MNAPAKIKAAEPGLPMLREPFPDNQVSKLPKESKAQSDARKADRNNAINCATCGGWHHKNAVHLDYVGHAALTDRLLDTDIEWSWEPVAFTTEGLPAFDRTGGLWIKLTVCGVSRLGYGAADGKTGGDAVKEIIGDALRNAAMRFGAALDLWHKGDLHVDDDEPATTKAVPPKQLSAPTRPKPEPLTGPMKTRADARLKFGEIVRELQACADEDQLNVYLATVNDEIAQFERELPEAWKGDGADFKGLRWEIDQARIACANQDQSWKNNPLNGG